MLDRHVLPPLQSLWLPLAKALARRGVQANALTVLGFSWGMAACAAVALGWPLWGLAGLAASRLLDGLDGSVARLQGATNRGAFLDISLDFVFYAAWPSAFALAQPQANALAAAVLLASFVCSGTSFLAYAVMAERQGSTRKHPQPLPKGFVFLGGLAEGTETVLCFACMAVWPQHFAAIAYGFAALCLLTAAYRVAAGWRQFDPSHEEKSR